MRLTARQEQVMNAMCRYGNVVEAAAYLDITPRSVEIMLQRIKEKKQYKHRMLLILDWDRLQRKQDGRD